MGPFSRRESADGPARGPEQVVKSDARAFHFTYQDVGDVDITSLMGVHVLHVDFDRNIVNMQMK